VPRCPDCGRENRADARFCDSCGAALAEAAPSREQRKTVTVAFCDVTGSTHLGERLDPESLRQVMVRYFDAMRDAIEGHGGTVEKFIGDAVMAVFGVPVLHEDDALRAVRAAADMRSALAGLNEELARDYGTVLQIRIGVNTGEVVTGTEERLATGDAVNVAARLEQAAGPGEILIGEETLGLARDAVEVEPVEGLTLKGKTTHVRAYRLLSVDAEAPAVRRRLDVPMVGRSRELRRLREAYAQAVDDRSCQLFTILGQAGVGKSRLAEEFLSNVEEATVVRGRCLPYGEGITYWPVVEAVLQLTSGDAARVAGLLPDPLAASAIEGLLGRETAATSPEEVAWAFRKLLEGAASTRAVVCVFDDLHWGESTLLELVEHVADLSRNAPILLLCMARPELLDRRPSWGGGKLNATSVLLEPLDDRETDLLIEELSDERLLAPGLRAEIRESAEGNPFFVEEMLALAEESGDDEIAVPPTIHALLAARLDQLNAEERAVLERGSVEGRVFHRGAVQALLPDEEQVTTRLTALVRKELVRPDEAVFAGDDAFRFRHLLIRDAAYDGLPKAARASLHERFADWLEQRGRELVELDEIAGYHLEQAYRYLAELGPVDDHGRRLARRAAEHLVSAAERAGRVRSDMAATVNLLERVGSLLPESDPLRLEVQPLFAAALMDAGRIGTAEEVLRSAFEAAERVGDARVQARASLALKLVRNQNDPAFGLARGEAEIEELIEVAQAQDDAALLAEAWFELGKIQVWLGRGAEGETALAKSLELANRCGDRRQRKNTLSWLALTGMFVPLPAAEVIRRNEEISRDPDAVGEVQAFAVISSAFMAALQGRFDVARSGAAQGRALLHELGHELSWAGLSQVSGEIELLADDPASAERELRSGYDALAGLGETAFLSSVAGALAEAVRRQGRLAEALELTEGGERAAARDDFASQAAWRCARARIFAAEGRAVEAERLARDAVAILEPTDALISKAQGAAALADVMVAAGRPREAVPALEDAIRFSEQKGDVVTAAKARADLDRLLA
jgi:class 3 adenylate cyclase/tetratricopeptide (TPR) repeat protein